MSYRGDYAPLYIYFLEIYSVIIIMSNIVICLSCFSASRLVGTSAGKKKFLVGVSSTVHVFNVVD